MPSRTEEDAMTLESVEAPKIDPFAAILHMGKVACEIAVHLAGAALTYLVGWLFLKIVLGILDVHTFDSSNGNLELVVSELLLSAPLWIFKWKSMLELSYLAGMFVAMMVASLACPCLYCWLKIMIGALQLSAEGFLILVPLTLLSSSIWIWALAGRSRARRTT
jgi:hypothetical protein